MWLQGWLSGNYSLICVYITVGGGGGPVWVFTVWKPPSRWINGCQGVQESAENRGPTQRAAGLVHRRTCCIKGPLLKGTCILGTNSSKRFEQEQMRLYTRKKKGKSEQVWGFLMAAEVFVIICTCPTKRGKTPSVPAWNKGVHIWRLLPRYRRQTLCFGFEVAKIAFEICSYEQPLSMGKKRKSLSASTKSINWLMHVYRTFILNMIDGFKQTCNNPEVLLSPLHICWMHWQPS